MNDSGQTTATPKPHFFRGFGVASFAKPQFWGDQRAGTGRYNLPRIIKVSTNLKSFIDSETSTPLNYSQRGYLLQFLGVNIPWTKTCERNHHLVNQW